MRKNIITVLLILIIPMFAYWLLNTNDASTSSTVAEASNKPQIIKFTSEMCMDCQTMNQIMKEIYPAYKDKITLIEIPVQDKTSFNQEQIKKYKVTLVPTIILIDSNGKQVKRIEGAIEKDVMDSYLQGLN